MRVYTNKLTPDGVVTCLFHNCERSLWLFCLVWTARRLPVLRVCEMFEGLTLTEFCFVFRFGFRASLLDFTSRIERLHRRPTRFLLLRRCMKCLAYFCSDTVAHVHRQPGHRQRMSLFSWRAWPISCSRSTAAIAAYRFRPLSHAVHWCVTHCRQAVCSELWSVITL